MLWRIKKDAPEEIKRLYDEYVKLPDDNIVIDDNKEESTQNK